MAEESATGAVEAARGSVERIEPTKLQQAAARRIAESKATAPHFYLRTDVRMGACIALRAQLGGRGPTPSFADMVVRACALALREFPRLNGAYRDGAFEAFSRINIGIAVTAHDAQVVPTIFDADGKGLAEIAAESSRLAERATDGSITSPELAGGTFTVAAVEVEEMATVIHQGQAANLAVGGVAERALVDRSGSLVAAPALTATLSCDGRIVGAAAGAAFLERVRRLLEDPVELA